MSEGSGGVFSQAGAFLFANLPGFAGQVRFAGAGAAGAGIAVAGGAVTTTVVGGGGVCGSCAAR